MKHTIVAAAAEAYRQRIDAGGSVADHTRNASAVARAWKSACVALAPTRIAYEVAILPGLNQRIDLLDREEACAYELKVSGKNAYAEFYKDVVKILMWNEERDDKIRKLIFITEEVWGRKYLDTEMPKAFIKFLRKHGLEVEIEYVRKG